MSKVDGSISSLIQGVSQQPDRERLPGQCTVQENFSSNPVDGLTRRGPMEFIKGLLTGTGTWRFDNYDAGSFGEYIIAYQDNKIKVFSLDGNEHTVNVESGADYIPNSKMLFSGIDDSIYCVDPTKEVAMLDTTREYVDNASLIFLLGGQYGRTYKIDVTWENDGVEFTAAATYTTPSGSTASHITNIGTAYIAENLYNDLNNLSTSTLSSAMTNLDSALNTYQTYYSYLSNTCTTGTVAENIACNANKSTASSARSSVMTHCNTIIAQLNLVDHPELRAAVQYIYDRASANASIAESYQTDYNLHRGDYLDFIDANDFKSTFTIEKEDDVIYIRRISNPDDAYTIEVEDGDGGTNMFAVNNQQTDVGNIPRFAPQGYIVRLTESKQTDADNWYLEFLSNEEGLEVGEGFGTSGVWIETVAPDLIYELDRSTLPHVLKREEDGTFTFREGEWADRAVGDEETNPLPTFVGHTISDMGAFQGRLVMLSDVNVIMSRTNKHLDFFNQSAISLNDDDPIDISSAIGTYVLKSLAPHNRDLVIFSDDVQFVVFGRNSLTPRNTSLVLTTEFEADLRASPVAAGRNVFFAYEYGKFTGIHEFFTQDDINDARPITQHVAQYIKGAPEQLISTTNFSKLVVRTDDDNKTVYVYEYVWLNGEKVQSSWSKWKFPLEVLHMFFVDNLLYAVTGYNNKYELYTIDLDSNFEDGLTYRVNLDQKVDFVGTNYTMYPDYEVDAIENYVAVQGAGCPNPGMKAKIAGFFEGQVTLDRDMEGGTVHFGRKYTSRYKPSMPFVRDRDGVKVGGLLILKQFIAHFTETGFFKALITDDYGYSAEVSYNGRVIGDPNNVVGQPSVSDGAFKIPFKKKADNSELEITTDSHLPASFLELEWLGQYRKRGKRITGG